ncbi:glutamate racemase [Synechococcus sp. CCY9201]|uniref:glutamate racemase n=1 Tax=unclassified Synechococcus TaxID=2626047 RepID=UPI0018CCAEE3|nr:MULTISPECIES: glutamate racemase [unclassified Synechococcus]MEA5423089.1 glutamate racemase [Synechococcus sp. CCY9202]MEA5473878.1 glutamate racemase [Synechococcus sp. CCY9201]QPN59336.1 glutamate racemase [Synechococcus sp. CBW1002]CAK6695865.1 Glutamate racemase [Synechococcus sp. CBW1107]
MSLLIGLFDSGLGGLTVLRQIQALYPHSPCLYLGDTARVPYGERTPDDIRAIAAEVVHWLRLQGVGVLVMACNTSNALALDVAVAEAGVPVVGLIDSVASELCSDRIGVLATPATAASAAYGRAIHACRPTARVIEVGCPAFVPLIEAGNLEDPALEEAARGYLQPMIAGEVDTIVLGCTHYPLLRPLLRRLLPQGVRLVDPAQAAARRLGPLLGNLGDSPEVDLEDDPIDPPRLLYRYCVTGSASGFAKAATRWLERRPRVETVELRTPS